MGSGGGKWERGASECSGSLPFTAAAQVPEFEGKVSSQLPSWSLGHENQSALEDFTQETPSWLCRASLKVKEFLIRGV